jgi:hypothetical protein
MEFGSLIKKFTDASSDKIAGILEEYRRAISMLEVFGLRVGKLRVTAGLLPEVSTTIVGSMDFIQPDRVRQMIDANQDKKILVAVLSALLTARSIRETVELQELKSVVIDIVLGVPPKITVELV